MSFDIELAVGQFQERPVHHSVSLKGRVSLFLSYSPLACVICFMFQPPRPFLRVHRDPPLNPSYNLPHIKDFKVHKCRLHVSIPSIGLQTPAKRGDIFCSFYPLSGFLFQTPFLYVPSINASRVVKCSLVVGSLWLRLQRGSGSIQIQRITATDISYIYLIQISDT